MKKGLSIQELAAKVADIEACKRDYIAPTDKIKAVAKFEESGDSKGSFLSPRIEIEGQGQFKSNQIFDGQVVQWARQGNKKKGIPGLDLSKRYHDQLKEESPALWAQVVNHALDRAPARRQVRTLINGDRVARAFFSDSFQPFDNSLVLESALEVLSDRSDLSVVSSQITDRRLYLAVTFSSLEGEIKGSKAVGDVVRAGLVISNSEVGAGAVSVERLIYRLVCLNGMVRGSALRKYHVGRRVDSGSEVVAGYFQRDTIQADQKAFGLKLRDTVKHAFDRDDFEADLERFSLAAGQKLEGIKLDEPVKVLADRFSFTKNENDSVLRHLIEGGDLSRWGMANAVTRAAHDESVEYDRGVELMRAGSKVIDLKPGEWSVVASAGVVA